MSNVIRGCMPISPPYSVVEVMAKPYYVEQGESMFEVIERGRKDRLDGLTTGEVEDLYEKDDEVVILFTLTLVYESGLKGEVYHMLRKDCYFNGFDTTLTTARILDEMGIERPKYF